MVGTLHNVRISTSTCVVRLAIVSLILAGVVAVGIVVALLNAPSSGQSCSVRHATAQDADGRTMWCDRASTGHRQLVWHYKLT
ncbi:hypothetical protein MRAB57_3661 [Mycobacterium rhizamassiliense]|uniref:Uncharacterized protein n=1 Tax=Mycobacterium rhizamassiliense TaxID=1841860 RepID=A0A2U3NWH1_9MYCO|nr:hypothetical protein [Mycobacterium rhizamassiliense]SPM35828.1 hypothetical protein MRAB57_3661 [Mycobacterium rhizamassiliense]